MCSLRNRCKKEKERNLTLPANKICAIFTRTKVNKKDLWGAEIEEAPKSTENPDVDCDSIMHWSIWCSVLIVVLLLAVQYGDGKSGVSEKDTSEDEMEQESHRSEIPRHHRSREAHSRRNRRAERGRYRSVLAVGVGCAVAGGWISLATVVYVVRYIRAKRQAAAHNSSEDDLL